MRLVFIVPVIIAMAILSGLVGFYYPDTWIYPEKARFFLGELCMASLVAAILTVTVERVNAFHLREMTDALQRNAFSAALKRQLPPALFTEVERTILLAAFYRREYRVNYILTPSLDGRMSMDGRKSFEVVNMTRSDAEYPVVFVIDRDKKQPHLTQLKSVSINGRRDSPKNLQKYTSITPSHIRYERRIRVVAGGSLHFVFEYDQVNDMDGFENIVSVTPSIDLELTVITPGAAHGIVVETSHTRDAEINRDKHDGKTVHCWKMPAALLPCQGIQFKWIPNSLGSAANTSASTAGAGIAAGSAVPSPSGGVNVASQATGAAHNGSAAPPPAGP